MSKFLTIAGLNEAISKIEKYRKEKAQEIVSVLDETALMIESGAKQNLTASGAVDTGRLRSSVVRLATGPYSRTVGTNVEYAAYIEFGTGSGVSIPSGLESVASQFKGKGIRKVNRGARPYLFPAADAERNNFIENIKKALSKV
jgi:phage gpG-like protein